MRKQKWLATLIAVVMVVALLPTAAFAAGEGMSPDNPIQINSAADLAKINQTEEYLYAELTADIDLADAPIAGTIDSWWNTRIQYFRGELDGNGHTITSTADNDAFIGTFVEGELKDIIWNVSSKSSLVAHQASSWADGTKTGEHTYSDITAMGTVNWDSYHNNESVLVTYAPGDTTFNDVTLNMEMTSPTYNGLFIGYEPYMESDYTFQNCTVIGNYTMAGVGVLFGNGSYSGEYGLQHVIGANGEKQTSTVTVTDMDLSNSSIIGADSTCTARLLCGVGFKTEMETLEEELAGNVTGYDKLQTATAIDGVTVSMNADNQIQITLSDPATAEIGSFEVISEVYASAYLNGESYGTYKFSVTDTLTVQDGVTNYYSLLGKVTFYDNSAAGIIGTTGLNGSLGVVTVDGEEYYTISEQLGNIVYNFGNASDSVGNTRTSNVKVAVYDVNGDLLGILNTTTTDSFSIAVPDFEAPEAVLHVGDKLSAHPLADGWAWADSDATVVEGGQWAFAVKDENMVPVAFTGIPVDAESVDVGEDFSLQIGQSQQLNATILPENTTDKIVAWASSNESVATVDDTGNVIALSEGQATITATVGTINDSCVVTVTPTQAVVPSVDPTQPVEEVTLGVAAEEAATVEDTIEEILTGVALGNEVTGISADTLQNIAQALENNQDISTEVVVELLADVSPAEQSAIMSVLEENETVAQYLDIRILVKANDSEIGTINELNREITFTIAIPEDLKAENRTFWVVRLHNGVAERLQTTMNPDGTLSFSTDKFSTYALIYEDSTTTPPVDPGNDNVNNPTDTPETGHDSNIIYWIVLMLLSGGAVLALEAKRRNKKSVGK